MKLSRIVSGSVLGFIAALALAGALTPALASAQTYPYYYNTYGNCGSQYSYGVPFDPYLNNLEDNRRYLAEIIEAGLQAREEGNARD